MTVKLKASSCACGKVSVPPRPSCPLCAMPMDTIELDNHGKMLTYTIVHVVPEGFEAPRTVGLVQLGSGARVLCTIDGDHPLDSEVEVVPEGDGYKALF